MFPDGQRLAATLQIPKHFPEPSGCLEPMQGNCPQGVLSQAETPPALRVCLLQMSPSLSADEPAGDSEHRLACVRCPQAAWCPGRSPGPGVRR